MVISSRTPEGEPGRCPVCGSGVKVEPSRPPGDAPCPRCGHLIWFTAEETGDATLLRFVGGLIGAEAFGRLIASLDDRPSRRVIFDFGGVRFLSSASLGSLIHLGKRLRGRGGDLILRNLDPDLRDVFRTTNLDLVLRIEA